MNPSEATLIHYLHREASARKSTAVMPTMIFRTYVAHEVTDTMLEDAAKLFSDHYGTWDAKAASAMGPFAKAGKTSVNIWLELVHIKGRRQWRQIECKASP